MNNHQRRLLSRALLAPRPRSNEILGIHWLWGWLGLFVAAAIVICGFVSMYSPPPTPYRVESKPDLTVKIREDAKSRETPRNTAKALELCPRCGAQTPLLPSSIVHDWITENSRRKWAQVKANYRGVDAKIPEAYWADQVARETDWEWMHVRSNLKRNGITEGLYCQACLERGMR